MILPVASDSNLWSFVDNNASAIFGLAGIFVGSIMTALFNFLLYQRNFNLKAKGKILDKRINAHEEALLVVNELKHVGSKKSRSGKDFYPKVLSSRASFWTWQNKFVGLYAKHSVWWSEKTGKEMYLLQGYLYVFSKRLDKVPDSKVIDLATIVVDDIIGLSDRAEKKLYNFFNDELVKGKINQLSQRPLYDKKYLDNFMNKTELVKRSSEIEKLMDKRQKAEDKIE